MTELKASAGATRKVLAAAASMVLLAATGCGLEGGGSSSKLCRDVQPGSVKAVDSLGDAKVKVGSKDFTEQLVLGEMSIALVCAAGAEPVDETNMSGTRQVRNAIVKNKFDLYWEYVGTGWSDHLQHTEKIGDVTAMYKKLAAEDIKNGVKWMPPSKLVNSYGLAMGKETAARLKITKLSQLKSLPQKELTFCMGTEFQDRENDGFKPMLKAYGIDPGSVPTKNLHAMQDGLVYGEVAKNDKCNFASTFTTDGRIAAKNLETLEDDKHFWPPYYASLNVNKTFYDKYPDIWKAFEPVSKKLTVELMQELNGKVDIDGEKPRKVARDWLKKEGFIK